MPTHDWLFDSGYILAFLTAVAVILVDCDNAMRKGLRLLPVNILKSGPVWVLAVPCGLLAALCFRFSYSELLTQIVELKWKNPALRGILVGIAVLTILRSRFFNIKENEIGGELLYNLGRRWALRAIRIDWLATKNRIVTEDRITAAIDRPAFEAELDAALQERLELEAEDDRNWVRIQFDNARKTRPSGPPDSQDPSWRLYYQSLLRLALDCGGVDILSNIEGLR